MGKTIKILVVGSGYWGINYVRLLSQLPDVKLVGVCDRSENRLQETKKNFPLVKLYKDLDEVLDSCDFNTAVVCTNPSNHFEIASRLLNAEKHLLVEKPITTTSKDALRLNELADQKGLILMVGHIFLFNCGIARVKEEVDNGHLGKIHYMYSRRTNLGPIRNDVNAVWDLAPHDISIFNYFMNSSPDWVSAIGSTILRPDIPDVGFIALKYANGVIGHIHVSWVDPNKVREVGVVGSEQRVFFNDLSSEKVTIYKKGIAASSLPFLSYGDYQLALRDGDIISPRLEVCEPLKAQVEHFIDCVRNGQRPICDGISGANVVKVLEAADKSIKLNGSPVKLDEL